MKEKAYYLSLEALISLSLLALLLSMPLQETSLSLNSLHVFKKESELLLFWVREWEELGEKDFVAGFEFAFPGKSGEIFLDGKKLSVGKKGLEGIANSVVFFDRKLQRHELTIVVFKQDFS